MAIFEIQGPDGAIYEIDAPDEQAAISGFQQFNSQPPAPPPAPEPNIGMGNSIGRGAAQGLTLGLNDEMRGLVEAGGTAPDQPASLGALVRGGFNLLTGSGGDEYAAGTDRTRKELEASRSQNPIATTAGEIGGALGSGLGLIGGGLSLGANAARAGHGIGRIAAGSAADGVILGGIQGVGSADSGDRLRGGVIGAGAGGVIGAAAPLAISGASNLFRRAISPFATNTERQAAAQVLRNEGVDLSAGQITGSKGLRYAEGEIGGSAAENLMERQGEQFTRAALKRAGVDAPRATPEVIDDAFNALGREFDSLASRNQLIPDQQFVGDLRGVISDYGALVPESMRAPAVLNIANDIVDAVKRGPIDGQAYQSLRSRLERVARSAKADPELSQTFRGIKDALDDAMERSIAVTNPADAGAWRQVRDQYRNMLVLEKASTGAGENAAMGLISPSQLRNATVNQGRRSYARGQGDFAELARAGEALMKPMPQSGTAPRLRAQNLGAALVPTIAGAGAGGAYGAQEGGAKGALLGALLGASAPRLAGRAMMSRPGQSYLSNQILSSQKSPTARAIANLLLTNSAIAARE